MSRILAADIGGTHSRFALFADDGRSPLSMEGRIWLNTPQATSFPELIEQLRSAEPELDPDKADVVVLALAGPVVRGRFCNPPNIAWDVDIDRDGLPHAQLLNDFAAQAFACRSPAVQNARLLLPGEPQPDATLACIGAGTGLGHCALVPDDHGHHLAVPSEAGHAAFSFVNAEEQAFADYVRQRTGRRHVIGDLTVSGTGLSLLHAFLTGEDLEPPEIVEECQPDSPTITTFARFYGRACRQYALQVLALAGVFVAGGIAAKTPMVVDNPAFGHEFHASETHGRLLASIPVYLNANEDSGLWGAAQRGRELLHAASKEG